MPKKEQYQVSDEDKKILAELQKHSIKDIDSVAQHCGVSKQKYGKR